MPNPNRKAINMQNINTEKHQGGKKKGGTK
jgi:hypothetical protein